MKQVIWQTDKPPNQGCIGGYTSKEKLKPRKWVKDTGFLPEWNSHLRRLDISNISPGLLGVASSAFNHSATMLRAATRRDSNPRSKIRLSAKANTRKQPVCGGCSSTPNTVISHLTWNLEHQNGPAPSTSSMARKLSAIEILVHWNYFSENSSFFRVSNLGSRSHLLALSSPSCSVQGSRCKSKQYQKNYSFFLCEDELFLASFVSFLRYGVFPKKSF